ncbi:uncharacterized protein JN550_001181 [Neoarthrinium moseri]|uniref:uncharacterized protein n=1 Tax=Neoarthrinium moseri TaxID=1658444 RepID=UPI001FDDAB64|nr:uncharacterized protein JN550_001181 [Neoarthrinium moseri]KAI1877109.1 hypothetical protein JN550_001181 [Neoarthrinium moseri]
MPARASLSAFLATARSALAASASKKQTLTFVVGNESADLDSLCSALLFAYLRTYGSPQTLHIPLCHLPRDDLTLRPEFTEVLRRAATSPDDVITLDDLPELDATNTQWLLVDHNCLTGHLELFNKQVVGCVDHHTDEGKVPQESEVRLIEKSGSCMSLVVTHCREAWEKLKDADKATEIDAQLAHLAVGPILIDTQKLGDKNKTTSFDEDAVQYLETKLPSATGYDRTNFFSDVAKLKEDISPLSMRDILRKDYKEWDDSGVKLGTSSVPAHFGYLTEKAGSSDALLDGIKRWGTEKDLDLVTVLTAFANEASFHRELLLFARTEKGVATAKAFEKDYTEKLQLSPWSSGKLDLDEQSQWLRCWTQGRVENSRKQVAPMLREAMKAKI